MQITVKLSQSQLRDHAMLATGLSPKVMAIKPGTRVERNRKKAAKKGYCKHKGRSFD